MFFHLNATFTIQGKVLDAETGEPLIGANVLIVGTAIGKVTDLDGSFTFEQLKECVQLDVNFTGYEPYTSTQICGDTTLAISLQVGYNCQKSQGTNRKRGQDTI